MNLISKVLGKRERSLLRCLRGLLRRSLSLVPSPFPSPRPPPRSARVSPLRPCDASREQARRAVLPSAALRNTLGMCSSPPEHWSPHIAGLSVDAGRSFRSLSRLHCYLPLLSWVPCPWVPCPPAVNRVVVAAGGTASALPARGCNRSQRGRSSTAASSLLP